MSLTPLKAEQRHEMPALQMRAFVAPASLNEEKRTVKVQYASEEPCLRFDWWLGSYYEILAIGESNVRLGRMKSGAPALNSHRSRDLVDVVGVVEPEDVTTTECTVRFASDEGSEPVYRKVKDGIIRNVSVGYVVHKYQDITEPGAEVRTLKAVDWEPMEVSFVPIPADPNAGVRSNTEKNTCIILAAEADNTKGADMPKNAIQETTATTPASAAETVERSQPQTQAAPVDTAALQRAATEAERTRIQEINRIVRKAGLKDDFSQKLINEGKTIDEARAAVFDEMADEDEAAPTQSRVRVMNNERVDRRAAIENALLHRHNPSQYRLTDHGREYRGLSLRELAREELRYHGKLEKGMTVAEIAVRALHSTSDFPLLLSNVAAKTLRASYDIIPRTFLPFCRQVNLPDFKPRTIVELSEASDLQLVREGAEYKYGTFIEGGETWRIFTYGLILPISRETIINDDMNAFTRVPGLLGASAARKESDLVYAILTGNPLMGDGYNLFHANHKNLSNALLNVTGLGAMKSLLRTQKGLAAKDTLNLEAKYLIVPGALETIAGQLNGEIAPTKVSDVNPFRNSYQTIVEGRLDNASTLEYYMSADPAVQDTIEYGYLEGQEGPYIESQEGFTRDGVQIKIREDFGAKAASFRGLAKSTNNAS